MEMPNLASLYQSGILWAETDSHVGSHGPLAIAMEGSVAGDSWAKDWNGVLSRAIALEVRARVLNWRRGEFSMIGSSLKYSNGQSSDSAKVR